MTLAEPLFGRLRVEQFEINNELYKNIFKGPSINGKIVSV